MNKGVRVVRYFFDKGILEFDCPFCNTVQGWPLAVQLINNEPSPSPRPAFLNHFYGENECPKFLGGDIEDDYETVAKIM